MSDISEIKDQLVAASEKIDAILEDATQIHARIDALVEGQAPTAEELNALKDAANSLNQKLANLKSTTAGLDGVSDDAGEVDTQEQDKEVPVEKEVQEG